MPVRRLRILALAAVAGALGAAQASAAVPLGALQSHVNTLYVSQTGLGPTSLSDNDFVQQTTVAVGTPRGGPTASVVMTGIPTDTPLLIPTSFSQAEADARYKFAVLGFGRGSAVHLLIRSAASASGQGAYDAAARVELTGGGQELTLASASSCAVLCEEPGSWSSGGGLWQSVVVQPFVTYQIELQATGFLQGLPGNSLKAFADPTIVFDPAYDVPDGARLAFSEGVPGGVPEPATWALAIVGFGGAGLALRRRRAAEA